MFAFHEHATGIVQAQCAAILDHVNDIMAHCMCAALALTNCPCCECIRCRLLQTVYHKLPYMQQRSHPAAGQCLSKTRMKGLSTIMADVCDCKYWCAAAPLTAHCPLSCVPWRLPWHIPADPWSKNLSKSSVPHCQPLNPSCKRWACFGHIQCSDC